MIGLAGVLAWAAWQHIYKGVSIEAIYPPAVNFLFWWFVAWAILMAAFSLSVIITTAFGVSSLHRGILKGIGIGVGGSILGIIVLLLSYGALIFGTFILKGALVNNTWDIWRLIFGGALLGIGLCLNRTSSSLSSSKKSDDD